MNDARARQRRVQIVFLVLMALSAAQVLWWILDQNRQTARHEAALRSHYETDMWAAEALLGSGMPRSEVAARFTHLELVPGQPPRLSSATEQELREERRSRLNQYSWEGGFFLLVLVAGMGVVWRAVHQDSELRLRQRNFLAAVSHELKSPLASMQLTAETLALREPPAERRRKLVQRLLEDLERLGTLLSNMLDASRLEQGRVEVNRRRLLLPRVLRDTVAEMADRAADVGVQLEVEPLPEDLWVNADPVGMRTVLRNLIDNAVKSTQESGGGLVRLRARGEGEPGQGRVVLLVEDDGVGFPPEAAEKIFEQFFRLGDELRRSTPGTGLGLSITRRILALENASIRAHSEGPGQGATLTVVWPWSSPADEGESFEEGPVEAARTGEAGA